jgi:hypothetical protein
MTSQKSPGLLRRTWRALGVALRRCILGKSSPDYLKQFTGSDEYWDRAIAAQLGWPQEQPPKEVRRAGPGGRDSAGRPLEPEYEPVHGWTIRQLDDYLARNPGYRATYEAKLHQQGSAAAAEVNGSSPGWLSPRKSNTTKPPTAPIPKGDVQIFPRQSEALSSADEGPGGRVVTSR